MYKKKSHYRILVIWELRIDVCLSALLMNWMICIILRGSSGALCKYSRIIRKSQWCWPSVCALSDVEIITTVNEDWCRWIVCICAEPTWNHSGLNLWPSLVISGLLPLVEFIWIKPANHTLSRKCAHYLYKSKMYSRRTFESLTIYSVNILLITSLGNYSKSTHFIV